MQEKQPYRSPRIVRIALRPLAAPQNWGEEALEALLRDLLAGFDPRAAQENEARFRPSPAQRQGWESARKMVERAYA